jgi:hypothetical protein
MVLASHAISGLPRACWPEVNSLRLTQSPAWYIPLGSNALAQISMKNPAK